MAAISTIIAGAALGVTAVGTVAQVKQQKKQTQLQQQANEFQQKQANLQMARSKRDAVREARLAYGAAQNSAANQGVSDSSGSQGGLSSISSQAADNVSFLDQYGFYSDQASALLGKANMAAGRAATAGSVAGLGMSVFNNANGIARVFGQE